jgi:hypothetical protein
MKIQVLRVMTNDNATIGTLMIDGIHQCHTLEDKVREVTGAPVSDWKVRGVTAIPKGCYEVRITFSNRFKRPLPLLLGVEGFEGIRIHPGNTSANTEGCILVGTWDGKAKDFIGNSRNAFDRLYQKIKDALEDGETVKLEIA